MKFLMLFLLSSNVDVMKISWMDSYLKCKSMTEISDRMFFCSKKKELENKLKTNNICVTSSYMMGVQWKSC